MFVNVIGFKVVSGKRKNDGSAWSAVNLFYTFKSGDSDLVGDMCENEFINIKFLDILSSNGLGEYRIDFSRGYDGKAYVSGLEKI